MICVHHTPYPSLRFLPVVTFLTIFLCSCQGARVEAKQSLSKLPALEQAVKMSESRYLTERSSKISQTDVVFEVKRNYSLILARREQLEISKEVKGHFEKAVTQAEKKFEEGNEDISQSAITKLKLGLAGTLNDISQFKSDIALAQLRLEKYLGVQWTPEMDISGPKVQFVGFLYTTVDEFLRSDPSGSKSIKDGDLYKLREAIIDVNKSKEQLSLASKNRKIARALLVTEAANYDFGIGNEADLFEALIIYTRVQVGYYNAIHTFNVAVHRFHSLYPVK